MDTTVPAIRRFHRTVTQRIGALSDRYLDRDRPLVESRLLFEIGARGAPVGELRARLALDSGFLSRTLRALEAEGLVETLRRDGDDGRVRFARLTAAGRVELRTLNRLSDRLAQSILAPLSPEQQARLLSAMGEVERLVRASAVEFSVEDPASAAAKACLHRYYDELGQRFRHGFDPALSISTGADEYRAPTGCFFVARLFGEPIGCAALRAAGPGIAEVKRMWVSPSARGLGIGRRMLGELEDAARARRARRLRLETNESLVEAQALYRANGFAPVEAYNREPYAHLWFEKKLRAPGSRRRSKIGRCKRVGTT